MTIILNIDSINYILETYIKPYSVYNILLYLQMTLDIENYFIMKNELPENFIFFNDFKCRVANSNTTNKKIIFKILSNEESYNWKYSDIGIYQLNENDIYEKKAVFYNHYNYTIGFKHLLKNSSLSNYVKLIITSNNNSIGFEMDVSVYICKTYLLESLNDKYMPKLLHQIIVDNHTKYPISYDLTKLPVKNTNITNIENTFLRNPYQYQKNNMKWMLDIETRIDMGKMILETYQLPTNKGYYLHHIDSINEDILVDYERKYIDIDSLNKLTINIKGGVLADDIGLGKTFSIIGLIYLSLQKDSNEMPSLILAPSRLCKQWLEEINKSCQLKTKIISSITQFRKLTLPIIKEYDVFIFSYNFLTSAKYIEYRELYPESDILLDTIQWKRLILDEGHEFINTQYSKKEKYRLTREYLEKIPCNYKWICSGTPYTNYNTSWEIISFICNLYNNPSFDKINKYSYYHIYQTIIEEIFIKNTKKDVENQVSIPDYFITNDFLDMTGVERIIYDSALNDRQKQIELCNHILVSEEHINILGNKPLPLNEIHHKMTNYYLKHIAKDEKKIEKLEEDYQKYLNHEKINVILDLEKYTQLKLELNQTLTTNKSKLEIFKSIDTRLKETETCPICLEELDTLTKTITACGHFFCASCIGQISKKNNNNCPICRQSFELKELQIISVPELNNVEQLGTKITKLVEHLNELLLVNKSNRIIVFSQWDSMLKMISKVLLDKTLNHIFLNGSFNVLNSKIRKFKLDSNIRIVLLSSDKSVSGLTLTEATHIVLLDTLNHPNKDIAKIIEEQAIGRAVRIGQEKNVNVKRFIMRNTIEHDYFLTNNY